MNPTTHPETEVRLPHIQDGWVALIGNPNSGKTAIFNLLTGLNQKVSNYPGVTVEQKLGTTRLSADHSFQLLDLPGTYSLTPESFDERIVVEQVLKWIHGLNPPTVIVSVVDASNLSRNLYLTSQLLDLGIPVVVALNMMDLVPRPLGEEELKTLQRSLGAAALIPMSAKEKWGHEELKTAIAAAAQQPTDRQTFPLTVEQELVIHLDPLARLLEDNLHYFPRLARAQALRLITRNSTMEIYRGVELDGSALNPALLDELQRVREETIEALEKKDLPRVTLEASLRYQWLDQVLQSVGTSATPTLDEATVSERADRIITHRWLGPLIFVSLLYFIFQSIFTWATVPMGWIENGVAWTGRQVLSWLPAGLFREVLVEGVIGGVGAIVVFLPQILILVFFLTLLEDSGYMARVAFMLDRFMTRVGLHGRSVLPLMSGYACAIPGIMATRTIDSWKERLVTILVLPLISCSARLPVYTLMIGAFIPATVVGGLFNLQGLTLVMMYFLGTATALVMAKVFSRMIVIKGQSTFVMEMPPYRLPIMRSVLRQVYLRGKLFVLNAGRIILAISIVLWFLASFPQTDRPGPDSIHTSYAGRIGHTLEPVIRPLGFDWKIGIGLITSFAAREVVVSTMATIYNVEQEGDDVVRLSEALRNDRDPLTGRPRYTPLMALALMVFYVFAAQCMATFAIVRSETNSWKWPLFMIVYMTTLAYLAALLVYQGGKFLGYA